MLHLCRLDSHLPNLYSMDSFIHFIVTKAFWCRQLLTLSQAAVCSMTCFMFLRVKREYETSGVEQLVPGTHPDRRPLLVHQPVFRPNWCNSATGGSAASGLPCIHAPQQTQPAPQHRFVQSVGDIALIATSLLLIRWFCVLCKSLPEKHLLQGAVRVRAWG